MSEANREEQNEKPRSIGEEWVWFSWSCLTGVGVMAFWFYFPNQREFLIEQAIKLLERF